METLSTYAQPFFEWLLRSTLQASVVICLILLIQAALRNKLTARWHYSLWLILVVRMVLPWAPQSRFSIYNFSAWLTESRAPTHVMSQQDAESAETPGESPATRQAAVTQEPAGTIDAQNKSLPAEFRALQAAADPATHTVFRLSGVLSLLWLAGALLLGGYIIFCNLRLWQAASVECPSTDKQTLELLEECRAAMGLRTIVALVPSEKVNAPVLLGFARPRLLVPKHIAKKLSREELRYVFLHELAHVKRHDIALGWLTSLLQVLHWFNPLVWLAFHRMRSNRESACDALVLSRVQGERAENYGLAIVSLLEHFSAPQPLPGLAGILESKSQLKRRIAMIAQFNNKSYRWSPLTAVLILILGCVSLPDAQPRRNAPPEDMVVGELGLQPIFRKIQVPTEVPWSMRLSPDGTRISLISDKKLWIMPTAGQLAPNVPGEPVELDTGGVLVDRAAHAWSADGKWIAFNEEASLDSNEGKGNAGIYVIPSEGGTPTKVHETYRDHRTVNYRISLSPDGKMMAFSSVDVERKEQHIYTIPVDGGKPKGLVDMQAREPVYSPDGKMIAFVADGDMGRSGGGLWVVSAQGGSPKQIADALNASSPIWSPQGNMIAFLDYGEKKERINVVGVSRDGNVTGDRVQTDVPEGISGVWLLAGWSPDNRIGAIFERPPESGLYTVAAEGGKAMQVAYGGGQPRWSPDGKRIFCLNAPEGDKGAWQRLAVVSFPSDGGRATTVPLRSDARIGLPNFGAGNRVSPDGKRIVFSGKSRRKPPIFMHNHIWTIPVEGGIPTQLTEAVEENISDMFPCWSPDGNYIAYVRARFPDKMITVSDVEANIYVIRQEGGTPTALTTESHGVSFGPIAWSPDGECIAYYSQVDETAGTGIFKVLSAEGNGESRIIGKVDQPHPGREFVWSPDGKRIAFNGSDGKTIAIMSIEDGMTVNIDTGLVGANVGPQLDWSPDGKRFVFAGGKGESSEFWVMENFLPATPIARPEQELSISLRRIKTGSMSDFSSVPSLDGKYLCDIQYRPTRLVIRDLVTGKTRPVTEPTEGYFWCQAISPDSKHVAYVHQTWSPSVKELHLINIDGTGRRVLYRFEADEMFHIRAWTPDGKKVIGAFEKRSAPLQLVAFSVEDGSMQVLHTFETYWPMWQSPLHKVAISPDGRYVAYDRPPEEGSWNSEIYVLDIENQRAACVLQRPAYDKLLDWAPDGRHIFFKSDRRQGIPGGFTATDTWDAYLLPVSEGRPQGAPVLVKRDIPDKLRPKGFTREGAYYYAVEFRTVEAVVARLDLKTGKLQGRPQVVGQTGADQIPAWSPDGRYLAYCTHELGGSQTIRIQEIATGQERKLDPNLPHFSWLRWSPDGKSFLVSNFTKNSPRAIYRINAETGERLNMIESDSSETLPGEPQLSPDGSTLFYVLNHSDSKKEGLLARDIGSGHEEELFALEGAGGVRGLSFELSPDGRQLALATQKRPITGGGADNRILIMSAKGGEPKELWKPGGLITEQTITWTPGGEALLFVKRIPEGGKELWLVPTGDGPARKLCGPRELMCEGMMYGSVHSALDMHPDGQRIAFDCFEYRHEVWVMENFLPQEMGK